MLKVWLPLTGDLHNQGISGVTATGHSVTSVAAGKIGSCYSFNGSSSYIELSSAPCSNGTTEFSYTCWAKFNSTASCCLFSNRNAVNSNGVTLFVNNSGNILYDIGNERHTKAYTFSTDTWYHLAFIYKKGATKKIYVNGAEIYSAGTSGTMTSAAATKSFIGASQNTSTTVNANYLNGYLNDVRIYDHALSATEVKEIAQGLVLHYKLDASSEEKMTIIPSTNAYSYPTFNTSTASGGWNHWGPSGHSGSYGQNTDKKYIYNKNNTYSHWITEDAGTGKYYLLYQNPAFEGGYRSLQAIIKEENDLPITESICYPNWNARNGGVPNNKWTTIKSLGDGFYYCCCEGVSQDGSNDLIGIIVHPGYKIYVSECYLENNTETCSPIFTYSSNIVQDSSGYNHNGTIIGNPTISPDTIRYSSCMNFPENTDGILSTFPISLWNNAFTYSFWIKPSGENGGRSIYAASYNGTSCSIEKTAGNKLRFYWNGSPDLTTSSLTITDGVWQHIAVVKSEDKTKVYCYYNGELKDTFTNTFNDKTFSGNLRIARDTRGDATSYTGLMSDFRIYCTPLLDTDIKQLYNVGMKVDKGQNIHTFELQQNQQNKLYKTGVLTMLNFYENGYKNILQYDQAIYTEPDGSTWAHIFHHNNPTNARFTNGTGDWSEGVYLDADRWYDVEKMLNNLVQYEFLVKQKTTSTATETKWRWVQNINPLEATWETVDANACIYNTDSEYSASSYKKGMYLFKTSQLHMCIANGSNGNWFGGIGACSTYQNGIPGYPNTTVTTGYIDLYVRIYPNTSILKNFGFSANQFIER